MRHDPILSRIEALEEENEHLRQRAERAEAALFGDDWGTPVAPLTLTQTRIMRLLAKKPMLAENIRQIICPDSDPNCVKSHLTYLRRRLIAVDLGHLAPPVCRKHFVPHMVPQEAVKAWLEGGDA